MPTTAQRPAKARKPAATPFSPTAARLIEQIQIEARAQLLTELSAKDTIVVLHGFDAATKCVDARAHRINIHEAKGNSVRLARHYDEPDSWRGKDHMAGYWHPARWYGYQTLVDGSGREWDNDMGVFVCNDFGQLVEVAA